MTPVPVGAWVCRTCHGPLPASGSRCLGCAALADRYGALGPDGVVPLAIAVKGGALAQALWRYKAGAEPDRTRAAELLTALLGGWLERHGRCVQAGGALAACVPGRGRGDALVRLAVGAGLQPRPLLGWRRGRLAVTPRAGPLARGAPVLLLDDTWSTGATAAGAAAALKAAGAGRVTVVVLGRHVGLGDNGALPYLRRLRGRPYDWDRCCGCADAPGGRFAQGC